MKDDPHPWAQTLATLYEHAWQRLARGVHDRHAPARHPTLATVSPEGLPQARTVVLRAAHKPAHRLEIHTNRHSQKIADITARPAAQLHVWDPGSRLQIRLEARVSIANPAATAEAWARVPEASRAAYTSDVAPGQPIAASLDYSRQPDEAAFVLIHLELQAMDLLHLGASHRRARFSHDSDWSGQWLVP